MKRRRETRHRLNPRPFKRTRGADAEAATHTQELLHITSGCACYQGQGYSPCDCPHSVEVTQAEFARRDEWTHEDVRRLVDVAGARRHGLIVGFHHFTMVTPCPKESVAYRLLGKFAKVSRMLVLPKAVPFVVVYLLNGKPRYCPTPTLRSVFKGMDMAEGAGRSTVGGVLVVDTEKRRMWTFGTRQESGDWEDLLNKDDGVLSGVEKKEEK
jgi:hypothetical protein